MTSVVELTVTTAPLLAHVVAAEALKLLTAGMALVVKAEVLALTVLVHVGVAVNAIAVRLTTLLAPAVFNDDVVNVPVPGLPEVKLIVAVVELTVLVPLTYRLLYNFL